MTTSQDRPRCVLYIRVSTDAQAETGYSVAGQREELREQLRGLGREVVDEVVDGGEKRWTLDRPGIDQLRKIAASGTVDEVWSWRWDRFGESPWPEVLAIELEGYGVTLRSLDDGGEGEDAEILRVLRSAMAKKERKRITERSRMGKFAKARRGEISGSAFKPRYGFRYVTNERGTAVGYEVYPEKMENVRTIFEALADGGSIRGVRRELEQGGVPAPGGGERWSTTTIRNMALEDAYLPRSVEELEGMVPSEVIADLDPEQEYSICWFGRRRSRFTGEGKARKVELQPREKWVAIPISLQGSGLDRATAERARAAVKDNVAPSKAGDRVWDLSGVLKCAECGRNMIAFRRRRRGGGFLYYYRCRPSSSLDLCDNRRSHRAENLEYEATRTFERYANRETMLALYDEAVARHEEQTGSRGILERRVALVERSTDLELERKGYLRQNARGVLSDADLDAMLSEVDEQRQAVAAELRATEDASVAVERLKAARSSLLSYDWPEDPDGIHPSEYMTFVARPEEIQRVYRRFGARFEVSKGGELTLRLEIGPDPGPGRGGGRVATETHTMMSGPPGSGKTMLARRMPGILPPLTMEERIEVTKVHSASGEGNGALVTQRPFRAPHHTVSTSGLAGGGSNPRPGEVSLAHHGVLFLDELPEFSRTALEALRQPLEDGHVTISRVAATLSYPARVTLLCSMNPCPCGYAGDRRRVCRCTVGQIERYQGRISGPLLDRMDLFVDVPRLTRQELREERMAEESRFVRARVSAAREIQALRQGSPNSALSGRRLREVCALKGEAEALFSRAVDRMGLSGRGHDRVLRVARTVADLSGEGEIAAEHVAEALNYRRSHLVGR